MSVFSAAGVGKLIGRSFKEAPALSILTAGFLGKEVVAPLVGGAVGDLTGETFRENFEEFQREKRAQAGTQLRAQKLQATMASNMARIAALDPHLYNELLVGRNLPKGAVVIGRGGGNTDFLEQVAFEMSTGGFQPPNPEQDAIASLAAQGQP